MKRSLHDKCKTLNTGGCKIFQEHDDGNFTARLTDTHAFNRIKLDKDIEVTLNKYSKTLGWTTRLSWNESAVNWWELNSSYRANILFYLNEFLNHQSDIYKNPDLSTNRIKKNETLI